MEELLSAVEARVLGCLIEKELTTPEYYPLSLNALTNACNQKSNRDPLMALTDEDVTRALGRLRFKQLAVVSGEGGRVAKYRHLLAENKGMVPAELSIICELLVRGPQTVGELRTRCERMHPFADLASVESCIQELIDRDPPLVVKLPRQVGRKEARNAHLFCGVPVVSDELDAAAAPLRVTSDEHERLEKLEQEVSDLRGEVEALRQLMGEFKAQFE